MTETNIDPLRFINAKVYTRAELDTAVREAVAETWKAALDALREYQESFVMNGGRSARDREKQRRQSFHIAGLDAARGAIESARAKGRPKS